MKQYVFHSFSMGDVEDPEVYAAMPISKWQETEQGQWVMKHCPDPQFRITPDTMNWGHSISIYGPLEEKDAVVFILKWQNVNTS